MTNTVFCRKYKEELEALDIPPLPGAKGKEYMETVSKKAWKEWTQHQTTLINEYQLNVFEPKARAFLEEQREKFFNNDETLAHAKGFKKKEDSH